MNFNKNRKKILLILLSTFFISLSFASAATINITTKYTKTGGIKGALNTISDIVNGIQICPANPTAGCDFSDDPGYSNNGTVNDPSDDTYSGDLIVRTNDLFEVTAAWNWSGVEGSSEEKITLVGTLPATGEYEWGDLPGSCKASESSISNDKLTITCVRENFTNTASYAEDLPFAVRVKGSAPNGATPGDISFSISGQNAIQKTDNTDGYSLTVTAAPR